MKLELTDKQFTDEQWCAICEALGIKPETALTIEGDFAVTKQARQQEIPGYMSIDARNDFACTGCAFENYPDCNDKACAMDERDDGRDVMFVKHEGDHLWQCPNCPELPGYQQYKCPDCGASRPTVKVNNE